jgi:hypothetical protein
MAFDFVNKIRQRLQESRSSGGTPMRDRPTGLSTPTTIRGNTAIGPSGGRATHFATRDASGRLTNVRSIPSSSWSAAQKERPRGSLFGSKDRDNSGAGRGYGGGGRDSGGGNSRTGTSRSSVSPGTGGRMTNAQRNEPAGPRGSGTRKRAGGVVGNKNWIKSAISKPGSLRSALKVKAGATISAKKLAAAAKKPGKVGQRARLAMTLKSFKKGK